MTVDQILLLRNDNDALYYDFIEYFLSAVVGKREYKMYRCDMLLSQFTTVSDEALAILIYKNNRETWVDMMNNNIKKKSAISWKYTNGGSSHGEIGSSQRYQGCSSDGMNRFNELFDLVQADRKSLHANAFEESFQDFCI